MDNRIASRPGLNSLTMQAVFEKLDAIDARIPEEIKAQVKTLEKEFREHQEECEQLLQNVAKQVVPVPKKRKAANSKQQGSTSASNNSNKSEGKRWRCGKTKQTKPKKPQANKTAKGRKPNKGKQAQKSRKAPKNSNSEAAKGTVRRSARKNKGSSSSCAGKQ